MIWLDMSECYKISCLKVCLKMMLVKAKAMLVMVVMLVVMGNKETSDVY